MSRAPAIGGLRATHNRALVLARRPAPGLVTPDVFRIEDRPRAEPAEGEFRVAVRYVSLDPAMRGWINEAKSYVKPVGIGEVMRAYAAGHVEASRHPGFVPGDAVQGLFGVQTHAISNGERVVKVDETQAPLARWVGGLGMPGWTGWFGMTEVCGDPGAGKTVVVSAASGAVGSIAGQIAKLKGARVVGIAGGPAKCAYVRDTLGFDQCLDYKAGNLAAGLDAACPSGIDVYFDNVGGEVLDAVLPRMNVFGRVAVCGMISAMAATSPPDGPRNWRAILTQRLTVRGLIVFDWADRTAEAIDALGRWHAAGRLVIREDVRSGGLEAFADTLNLLYTGGNDGKLVLAL
ncbi:MAG: NADP-dependent oxidoreductase [Hyphomicrobiaceae bacterium]